MAIAIQQNNINNIVEVTLCIEQFINDDCFITVGCFCGAQLTFVFAMQQYCDCIIANHFFHWLWSTFEQLQTICYKPSVTNVQLQLKFIFDHLMKHVDACEYKV